MSPKDIAALLETRANETSLEQALVENAERLAVSSSTDDGLEALKECIDRIVRTDRIHHVARDVLESSAKKAAKQSAKSKQYLRISDKAPAGVTEKDGEPVTVYKNEGFENYGNTLGKKIVPLYTFAPRTRQGVVSAVKFAREKKLRVRCAGSRMSNTLIFGSSGEVLISLTPLGLPGKLRDAIPKLTSDLERIQMVRVENRGHTGLLRISAGATADHFRKWAISADGGDWRWMLDSIPFLSCATSAGWTQTASHGSGVAHSSVSDLVTAIEFVNCRGEIQNISEPKQIRALSCGFGLFGVILSQTFRVSKLQLAIMRPRKTPTPIAVPPPSRAFAPQADDFDAAHFSDAQLENARKTFLEDAGAFHSEWVWYPFHEDVWVNSWETRAYSADSRPSFPSNKEVRWQRAHAGISELFRTSALSLLPALEHARLYAKIVMAALPADRRIDASVPDAMLFRRGVERVHQRSCGFSIPIPLDDNGKLDLFVVQKAWWMAINQVYAAKRSGKVPLKVALEMRVTGGSEVLLSPQRGNAATCAIELVTTAGVDEKEWKSFIQGVVDKWATLRDPVSNELLDIRPHWTKEWPSKIRGDKAKKYIKEVYEKPAQEWIDMMKAIAKEGGYQTEDMMEAFGNEGMLEMIGYQRKKGWLPRR